MLNNIKTQQTTINPLLEFKLNQPVQQTPNYNTYPMPYANIPNIYTPQGIAGFMPPWWMYTNPNDIPIIKKYNINLGGVTGDTLKISQIYEDMLPIDDSLLNNTFNSVSERLVLHDYIRSIFVNRSDGEIIDVPQTGGNESKSELLNLLSRIKILDINPYFTGPINQKYANLAHNFVIYRSCYPIRMNINNYVECSKSSVGINIRLYLLSLQDTESELNIHSDIWREVNYYNYIKEEIIKKKLSPNFILYHSYYLTKNTGTNFRKFDIIKSKEHNKILSKNNEIRNQLYIKYLADKLYENDKSTNHPGPPLYNPGYYETLVRNELLNIKPINKVLDSDRCLVMMTEAPTCNICLWASKTYKDKDGPINQMINPGYYNDNIWISIIFQLLIAFLVMINKKIVFDEFKIENNIFIKELNINKQNIGIWKYIYDGIEYYIPNYGYILLIDSNFADLDYYDIINELHMITTHASPPYKYKLLADIFNDNLEDIYKTSITNIIDCFTNLRKINTKGCTLPSPNIINYIDTIINILTAINSNYNFISDIKEANTYFIDKIKNVLIDILINTDINFILHNRIGTILKENEKQYISLNFDLNTKRGSLIVYSISLLYSFAIFSHIKDEEVYIITTDKPIFDYSDKENKKYTVIIVTTSDIYNYYTIPDNMFTPNIQYSILDTYRIDFD